MSFESIRRLAGSLFSWTVEEIEKAQPPPPREDVAKVVSEYSYPEIEPRFFAHRLVPAYLYDSGLEGICSEFSAIYWIFLLGAWTQNQLLFLDPKIAQKDLHFLRTILKEYLEDMRANKVPVEKCRERVKAMLRDVQHTLKTRKKYISLGYREGVSNHGHHIPFKIVAQGSRVVGLCLNQGNGMQLHPSVGWSVGVERRLMHYFPIHFRQEDFFSQKGEDLFVRLLRLTVEPCPSEVHPYDAKDVYGALLTLGKAQSLDGLDSRWERKPQLNGVCGDKAITLIIEDVLIDLGYDKAIIQRLFILEKLTLILFFHKQLQNSQVVDDWLLLKNGIQELAIKGLHASKEVLSEEEVQFCEDLLRPIYSVVVQTINALKQASLPLLDLERPGPCVGCITTKTTLERKDVSLKFPIPKQGKEGFAVPPIIPPAAQEVKKTLQGWLETAQALKARGDQVRASQFVYRAILSLKVPKVGNAKDFWDQVPEADCEALIDSLARLVLAGAEEEPDWIYRNVIIISTGYAIVDKLVRRKYNSYFHGFISPFGPARKYSEEVNLINWDFAWLPNGQANAHWVEVRDYFEGITAQGKATLFALDKNEIDIRRGIENLRSNLDVECPVKDHLKFLQAFLPQGNASEEAFTKLWLNADNALRPVAIERLYFLAALFHDARWALNLPEVPRVSRCKSGRRTWAIERQSFQKKQAKCPSDQESLGFRNFEYIKKLKESGRQASENMIECCCIDETDLTHVFSLKDFRVWVRMHSTPSLQITSLAQWMRSERLMLSEGEVQSLVEMTLFEPGILHQKCAQEPATFLQLRDLIAQSIDYYRQSATDLKTVFFLVRVGICIETYAPKPDLETLKRYEEVLLSRLNHQATLANTYEHLLFLYQCGLPNGAFSLRKLIEAQFWLTYHESYTGSVGALWLTTETSASLDLYLGEVQVSMADPAWVEATASGLLTLLLPEEPLPKGKAEAHYPYIKKGEYTFNLEDLGVTQGSRQLYYFNQLQRDAFSIPAMALAWGEEGCFYSTDGSTKIDTSTGKVFAGKRFYIRGVEGWYYKSKITHFDSFLTNPVYFDHWEEDGKIVICKRRETTPLYYVEVNKSTYQIYKLLPGRELVMMRLERNTPLREWFERLGAAGEACVWVNEKTGLIEEIEFLKLKLLFKGEWVDGTWRLRSQEFPELFFADEQMVEGLEAFKGCLVLENGEKRCVLIPYRVPQKEDREFSTTVTLKESFIGTYGIDPHTFFYIYQLDEMRSILVHSDARANLFLSLLCAMQRNYHSERGALFYLARSRSFDLQCEHLLSLWTLFYDLKDHSPEALAFYLRLGLHVIDQTQQVLLKEYSSSPYERGWLPSEQGMFFKWVGRMYEEYLRICTAKESSRIPSDCRLNLEEEKRLKTHLEKVLKRYEASLRERGLSNPLAPPLWRPVFDLRTALIEKREWTGFLFPAIYPLFPFSDDLKLEAIDVEFQGHFRLFPPKLFSITPPTPADFVRLPLEQVQAYFMVLYELARRGEGHLDFLYLLRSIPEGETCQRTDAWRKYLAVLRYVQRYPQRFADLQFGTDSAHNGEIFQAIIDRVTDQFESFMETAALMKSVYTQSAHFNSLRTLSLKLAPSPHFAPHPWHISEKTRQRLQQNNKSFSLEPSIPLARERLATKRKEALALKEQAERVANAYPKESYRLGLRRLGRDLPQITMEGLLTRAYQEQSPLILKRANPSLSAQQIEDVLGMTIEYHLIQIQIFRLETAIKALEKGDVQSFEDALIYHGDFDPTSEPEIILYQSRNRKSLWEVQAALLTSEVATEGKYPLKLASAQAGEGKTTLYMPIKMKRLNRLGYLPISFSLKPLYVVDREGLKESCQSTYGFEISVLELALSTQTKPADFQWIYEQLSGRKEEKGFKMVPETYYALHLKYQLALEEGDLESIKWLSQIFDLFETQGGVVIDECRLSCSPFSQAKIGIGRPLSLPEQDRRIILEIYQALMSPTILLENGISVRETVRLSENLQATMSPAQRTAVKQAVLHALSSKPLFQTGRGRDLLEVYFEEFFDPAMQLVGGMQHVPSIKSREEVHVPAQTRQPTSAYFEEVYVTLFATIQGLLQSGLQEENDQGQRLHASMERFHMDEVGSSDKVSEIETLMRQWAGDSHLRLNHFSTSSSQSMQRFYALFRRNEAALFWYLEHVVLKQAVYSPEYLTVTPMHLLHGFKSTTLISADPGPKEIYGIFEKGEQVYEDPHFLQNARSLFLDPFNKEFLTFPPFKSPRAFFESLGPEVYTHLSIICDAGGMHRDFTMNQIVADFFAFNASEMGPDFDGLVFFGDPIHQENETPLFVQLKGWNAPKELKGHDVVASLQAMGYNWEQLKLLIWIGPSHRAGANLKVKDNTTILLLLGEDLDFSSAAQGAYRARGLPYKKQRLIWGASEPVVRLIGEATPQAATAWTTANGEQKEKKELILSTYQQIDYWMGEKAWQAIRKQRDPASQVEHWKKHRTGFIRKAAPDPVARFKSKKERAPTKQVLWNYARERYRDFRYDSFCEKAQEKMTPAVNHLIGKQRVMSTSLAADVMQRAHIHTQHREETKTEQTTTKHGALKPVDEQRLPFGLTLDRSDFISLIGRRSQPLRDLFGSRYLTEGLYFTYNAIETAKEREIHLKEGYLKPTQYLLVVKDKGVWAAFALADREADFFAAQLVQGNVLGRQAALLTADGVLAQNGPTRCGFTPQELKSPFIMDVVTDVGLTRCEMMHPRRFLERAEQWEDFWPMWQKMKEGHTLPETIHPQIVEKLVPLRHKKALSPTNNEDYQNKWTNLFFKS